MEALGDCFDGVFGCAVDGEGCSGCESGDAGDIEDGSGTSFSHVGKDWSSDIEKAEDVDFKLVADFLIGDFLDHSDVSVSGVVDEDIYVVEGVEGLVNGSSD